MASELLPPRDGIYLKLTAVLSDGTELTVAVDPAVLVDSPDEAWRCGCAPAIEALRRKLAARQLQPMILPRIIVAPIIVPR